MEVPALVAKRRWRWRKPKWRSAPPASSQHALTHGLFPRDDANESLFAGVGAKVEAELARSRERMPNIYIYNQLKPQPPSLNTTAPTDSPFLPQNACMQSTLRTSILRTSLNRLFARTFTTSTTTMSSAPTISKEAELGIQQDKMLCVLISISTSSFLASSLSSTDITICSTLRPQQPRGNRNDLPKLWKDRSSSTCVSTQATSSRCFSFGKGWSCLRLASYFRSLIHPYVDPLIVCSNRIEIIASPCKPPHDPHILPRPQRLTLHPFANHRYRGGWLTLGGTQKGDIVKDIMTTAWDNGISTFTFPFLCFFLLSWFPVSCSDRFLALLGLLVHFGLSWYRLVTSGGNVTIILWITLICERSTEASFR